MTLRGPLQHANSPDCPQKSDDTEVHRSEGTIVQKLCIKYLLVLVNELCNETLVGNGKTWGFRVTRPFSADCATWQVIVGGFGPRLMSRGRTHGAFGNPGEYCYKSNQ